MFPIVTTYNNHFKMLIDFEIMTSVLRFRNHPACIRTCSFVHFVVLLLIVTE